MMKNALFRLLLCLCLLMSSSPIWANMVIFGYCNGQIADSEQGSIVGQTGNNSYISTAIHLEGGLLDDYRTGIVTRLRYGFPSGVTLPAAVTLWIRTSQSGENLCETVITPAAGWNEYCLPEPIGLTEVDELWVGMTFLQNKKMSVISLVGETHAEGCYVARGKSWSSLADMDAGSLSIEIVAESDDYPTHDLSLQEVAVPSNYCRMGDDLIVSGVIRNNATEPAIPLLHWEMCGQQGDVRSESVLNYRESQRFSFMIPTSQMPEGETLLRLELLWDNGVDDQTPANNVWETPIEISSRVAVRRMVCEEGTGLWCGWCVRGIVGLEQMTRNHPDTFIGIAAHNGDIFEVKTYSDWVANTMQTGFPGSVINRLHPCDPNTEDLEHAYMAMPDYSPYDISIQADFPDQAQSHDMQTFVSTSVTVTPLADMTESELRLAVIITEDSIWAVQNNDYAGSNREMDGWEQRGESAYYPMPHVARAIGPSVTGAENVLPASLTKDEVYTYSLNIALPQIEYEGESVRFVNAHKLAAIALLIDGRTGEILNAAKVENHKDDAEEAIRAIVTDEAPANRYYTLDGRQIHYPSRGYMVSSKGKILFFE